MPRTKGFGYYFRNISLYINLIDLGLYCTNKWLSYLHRWVVYLDDRIEPFRGHEILTEVGLDDRDLTDAPVRDIYILTEVGLDDRDLISAPGRGHYILTEVDLDDRDLTNAPFRGHYILTEVGL